MTKRLSSELTVNVSSKKESLYTDCDSVLVPGQPKLEQRWMTIEQIAARYQLSVRTIANMMADGRLPFYKVGRAIRFDPKECDLAMRAFRRASKFDRLIDEQVSAASETEVLADNNDSSYSDAMPLYLIFVIAARQLFDFYINRLQPR